MSWYSSFTNLFSTKKPNAPSPTSDGPEKPLIETSTSFLDSEREKFALAKANALKESQNSTIERPNRNKIIFGAGVAFFAFSLLITRRSFARRRLASTPGFYTNSPGHGAEQSAKVSGAMEAMEALNLATVNVLSLTMMATGGALWYLNINSMADARRMLRGGLGVDGTGRTEAQAEEEFEEWMATVLARKEAKASKATLTSADKPQQR